MVSFRVTAEGHVALEVCSLVVLLVCDVPSFSRHDGGIGVTMRGLRVSCRYTVCTVLHFWCRPLCRSQSVLTIHACGYSFR